MTEPLPPRRAPGKRLAFVLAALIHLLLFTLLIFGIDWQKKTPVVAVDLVSAPIATAPPRSPEPAPVKSAPLPPPAEPPQLKPAPRPAPAPLPPKPDIVQKDKAKAEPVKSAPHPPDPFQELLERELKEAEKRRAEEAAARELAELSARQAAARQASTRDQYIAAIRGKIRGNIVMPPGIKGNPEAVFEVTQLPSGDVLAVKLVKSSGQPAWDAATERAILKSSPLPKPAQPELFARVLELRFRPLDE